MMNPLNYPQTVKNNNLNFNNQKFNMPMNLIPNPVNSRNRNRIDE